MMEKYLNNPEATNNAISEGWYKTGQYHSHFTLDSDGPIQTCWGKG